MKKCKFRAADLHSVSAVSLSRCKRILKTAVSEMGRDPGTFKPDRTGGISESFALKERAARSIQEKDSRSFARVQKTAVLDGR